MKIAILTSGILPVPAVQGGAVENLVDFYLEYNDRHRLHDITVYSVWHPDVEKHKALKSDVNHYIYIKTHGWWNKLRKKIYQNTHGEEYYHYTIEYFLHQAIKDIRRQQYDAIVIENRPAYSLKLKPVTDAKLIYHLHNEKLTCTAPRCHDIFMAADKILTVSNFIKDKVQAICPDTPKTETVYNGIDLSAFSPDALPMSRTGMKLSADDFTMVFCGRVNKEKGVMELIDAMNLLQEQTNIKLLVIGSSFYGNANDEDTFARALKEKAAPLKNRIIFTGFVPYGKMPCYLKMADLAVIPSVWDDPFPTTVLEAQAMGLPIVTTRRGGIPEEVTEENAILLDTDEHFAEHLAAAILDLYNNPEKRKQMADASLKRSKLYDKETYARNFFAALE